jgi:hypothetical protein
MMISETDIFNYVFFRDSLPAEKTTYLEVSNLFRDEINFYVEMKKSLDMSIIPSVLEECKVHHLTPVIVNTRRSPGSMPRLAAASADLLKRTEFTTFTDKGSTFLCRLLKTENKNLLYIISADERTDKKVKVTLFPAEHSYTLNDISTPLELEDIPDIKIIHIEEV